MHTRQCADKEGLNMNDITRPIEITARVDLPKFGMEANKPIRALFKGYGQYQEDGEEADIVAIVELPNGLVSTFDTTLISFLDVNKEFGRVCFDDCRPPLCFNPETNNCYPLCVGNGSDKCSECSLSKDIDPHDND